MKSLMCSVENFTAECISVLEASSLRMFCFWHLRTLMKAQLQWLVTSLFKSGFLCLWVFFFLIFFSVSNATYLLNILRLEKINFIQYLSIIWQSREIRRRTYKGSIITEFSEVRCDGCFSLRASSGPLGSVVRGLEANFNIMQMTPSWSRID